VRTAFYKSFERDLKNLKNNRQVLGRIQDAIEEVEEASDLRELPSLKKLSGGGGDYYRIRVGD
jgi:mRNA-degrading endonuclease RelE of RelBE toxin-antitoxin system